MQNHEKFPAEKVINASGRMTISRSLGPSQRQSLDAQRSWWPAFLEMEELSIQTGKYLADCVRSRRCPDRFIRISQNLAQSVATVIGKGELYPFIILIQNPSKNDKSFCQKGHNVDYGTAVEIMVQQGKRVR